MILIIFISILPTYKCFIIHNLPVRFTRCTQFKNRGGKHATSLSILRYESVFSFAIFKPYIDQFQYISRKRSVSTNHGQTMKNTHGIRGDAMGNERTETQVKRTNKIKVNFFPVEGDMLEAVIKALEPRVNSVLSKHGATLKMDLKEIVRNHAKV